jgi:CheY-like chemotaxis protein
MNSKRRIAVVEDNPLHRRLCLDALNSHRYETLGISDFTDLERTVKDLAKWQPDLVVVDERLAGTTRSGLWLLEQLGRALPQETKYLLYSAYTDDPATLREYEKLGVQEDAVLSKSMDTVPELLKAVGRLLGTEGQSPS